MILTALTCIAGAAIGISVGIGYAAILIASSGDRIDQLTDEHAEHLGADNSLHPGTDTAAQQDDHV